MKKSLWVVAAVLLLALTILPACQKTPAQFELTSLEVVPPEVTVGQAVEISAQVNNTGGTEGIHTVTLTIDGNKVQTKVLKVAPKNSEIVAFTVTQNRPGTYTVEVNQLSGAFRTFKPAELNVSNLFITPPVVTAGQTATITIDVTNTGEVEGSHSATLMVNGSKVDTKGLVVAPGTTGKLSFILTEKNTGSYKIEVGELSGLFMVTETGNALAELDTAFPKLSQELLKLPDLEEIDDRDNEAMDDIAYLALNPKNKPAFEAMLNEGIEDKRKYCTPLQALLWIAYDKQFSGYDPLKDYSLTKLIDEAWTNTSTSQNYTSDRWKDFDEVVDRLNSSELIATYMDGNIPYDWEKLGRLDSYWQSPIETFNRKKGICQDKARFALNLLVQNGYHYDEFEKDKDSGAVMFVAMKRTGFPDGHVVCLYEKDNKFYTIDSAESTAVRGPFTAIDGAADATYPVWEVYQFVDVSTNITKLVNR